MSESDAPPARRSAKATAVVVVLLAFLAGVVAGIAGDRIYHFKRRHVFPERAARFMTPHVVARLDRALDLTPEQQRRITEILDRRQQRIASITSGIRPQVRREIEQTNTEIEQVLTPAQREKFGKLKIRMMHRGHPRERRGDHHRPQPPPV